MFKNPRGAPVSATHARFRQPEWGATRIHASGTTTMKSRTAAATVQTPRLRSAGPRRAIRVGAAADIGAGLPLDPECLPPFGDGFGDSLLEALHLVPVPFHPVDGDAARRGHVGAQRVV